jgi:hypothetical protein
MPESWAVGPAFEMLGDLQVGRGAVWMCVRACVVVVAVCVGGRMWSGPARGLLPQLLGPAPPRRLRAAHSDAWVRACRRARSARHLPTARPQMASNRFSGTFPSGFAVTNTSFISVMSL